MGQTESWKSLKVLKRAAAMKAVKIPNAGRGGKVGLCKSGLRFSAGVVRNRTKSGRKIPKRNIHKLTEVEY
jgi:hypothetical protein